MRNKEPQMKTLALVPLVALFLGCTRTFSDWYQGTDHIRCDTTDYVGTNVENKATQNVTVLLCSPDYPVPSAAQTIPAQGGPGDYSEDVDTHSQDTEVMAGDDCEDGGVPSTNQVGHMVPLLSAADQGSYQTCYRSEYIGNSSTDYWPELYTVILRSDTCPADAQPFD